MRKLSSRNHRLYALATGLLGMILCVYLPTLILHLAIGPGADRAKQGWWTHFSGPTRPLPVNGYEVLLPAERTIALNPDFKQATSWIIWFVPEGTLYKIQFSAEAVSRVTLDGKILLKAPPKSRSRKVEERWCRLTPGPHLFRLDFYNKDGGGWFSIGFLTPPLMRLTALQNTMVAMPNRDHLETWWWLMRLSRPGTWFFGLLAGFSLLALLLPLARADRLYATIITIAIVAAPALLIPDLSGREPYIGPVIHKKLQQKQPRYVFIGNSMLWSRIDDSLLEHLLGGVPVYSIVNFGGLSGIHYLAMKYLLIPSGIQPKRVFIFFRSTTLVEPTARTTGPYFETLIKRITPAPDPVFERLAHGRETSPVSAFQRYLDTLFSVQKNRKMVRDAVGNAALWLSIPGTGQLRQEKRNQLRSLVNKHFALKNVGAGMDKESLRSGSREIPDFSSSVAKSFLPSILELARTQNFPLVFVRVQERPQDNGPVRDTPEMKQFIAELKDYLTINGAVLYDFTGDPELPLSMYGQGDHIEDPRQYTPLFFNRLHSLLQ